MKTSQHIFGTEWNDGLYSDRWIEASLEFEAMHDARRRAALVFDVLLTYLAGDDPSAPRNAPSTH